MHVFFLVKYNTFDSHSPMAHVFPSNWSLAIAGEGLFRGSVLPTEVSPKGLRMVLMIGFTQHCVFEPNKIRIQDLQNHDCQPKSRDKYGGFGSPSLIVLRWGCFFNIHSFTVSQFHSGSVASQDGAFAPRLRGSHSRNSGETAGPLQHDPEPVLKRIFQHLPTFICQGLC